MHQVVCGEINSVFFSLRILRVMSIIHLRTASSIRATLSSYHPVFIEGPASRNDDRDLHKLLQNMSLRISVVIGTTTRRTTTIE